MMSATAAATLSGIGIILEYCFATKEGDGSKPPQDTVPSLFRGSEQTCHQKT